jgi:hypothetical protein
MPWPRFTPGKGAPVPFGQEAGWASELVWAQRLEENFFASVGDRTSVVRSVTPGKGAPVSFGQEAGWASELVWAQRLEENFFASVGDRTSVVRSVVRHYTDRATPAPVLGITVSISA